MEEQRSELVAEAILEDKLVDIWPEFHVFITYARQISKTEIYIREKAFEEIAEKLGQSGKSLHKLNHASTFYACFMCIICNNFAYLFTY